MIAALLIPMVGPASATASYAMSNVKNVSAGTTPDIGALEITLTPADCTLAAGNFVDFQLPSSPTGFAMGVAGNILDVHEVSGPLDPAYMINCAGTVTLTRETTLLYRLDIGDDFGYSPGAQGNAQILIPLTLQVPGGVSGDIVLRANATSGSVLPSGSITIATVGAKTVTLGVESTPSISSSGGDLGILDIKENAAGALYDSTGNAVLTLTLPPGFSWNGFDLTPVWGSADLVSYLTGESDKHTWTDANGTDHTGYAGYKVTNNNRELKFYNSVLDTSFPGGGGSTFFEIQGKVTVDESVAKTGNITVSIGGSTGANVSSAVLGTYGEFGVTADAVSAPSLVSGKTGQDIGNLEVKEGIPGSIIKGRTITLTLPSGVLWAEAPQFDSSDSTNYGVLDSVSVSSVGTNGNIIKITWEKDNTAAPGDMPADLIFKSMQVTPAVDFTGDVSVTVGGSEGVTGTVVLGKVAAGISGSAPSPVNNVKIGLPGQAIGDFSLTELAAGNLDSSASYSGLATNGNGSSGQLNIVYTLSSSDQAYLYIVAPAGITFDTTPTVTVTSGDLQLGTVTTGTGDIYNGNAVAYTESPNQGWIQIPIKSSSTTASTIKVSGAVVTIDRTVPEGPVTFKVKGTAVDETTNSGAIPLPFEGATLTTCFPNDTTALALNVANCVTPAPGETKGTAVFTIGKTSYTLNGTSVNMDVAPYIKDSRTFLPVRYVANALGVSDSNILWDPATKKVTLIKGAVVIQLTIGSNQLIMNGATITMDTAPEINAGRTCLPIAFVAQALGGTATWDATAQTVTITFQ
jgi:hypothetical protein